MENSDRYKSLQPYKKRFQSNRLIVVSAGIGFPTLMFFLYFSFQTRCTVPDYELYSLLRCGNPVANWLYDYQALLSGIFAIFAAIVTVCAMNGNTKSTIEATERTRITAAKSICEEIEKSYYELIKELSEFADRENVNYAQELFKLSNILNILRKIDEKRAYIINHSLRHYVNFDGNDFLTKTKTFNEVVEFVIKQFQENLLDEKRRDEITSMAGQLRSILMTEFNSRRDELSTIIGRLNQQLMKV